MSAEGKKSKVAESEGKSEDLDPEWAGERFSPGSEGEVAAELLHRYVLVKELVGGKNVLDIACGVLIISSPGKHEYACKQLAFLN